MKKLLSVLLACGILASVLTGCGDTASTLASIPSQTSAAVGGGDNDLTVIRAAVMPPAAELTIILYQPAGVGRGKRL